MWKVILNQVLEFELPSPDPAIIWIARASSTGDCCYSQVMIFTVLLVLWSEPVTYARVGIEDDPMGLGQTVFLASSKKKIHI